MTQQQQPLWVLGYGSLIYKPPPHYKYAIPGKIHNFTRRFWQSSWDHRGTPENPGRVATLISEKDINENMQIKKEVLKHHDSDGYSIAAVAFYIPAEHAAEVSAYLDEREKAGYTTHTVPFHLDITKEHLENPELNDELSKLKTNDGQYILQSLVYIGTLDSEDFIGPESIEKTADIIRVSKGPSGENREYLALLYHALIDMGSHDEYLKRLLSLVDKQE